MLTEVKIREEIKSHREVVERKKEVEHRINYNSSLDPLDEGSKRLVKELLELGVLRDQQKRTAEDVAVLHGLEQPYYLTLAHARKLLSQDEAGNDIKENIHGNNQVVVFPSKESPIVYFKRNPENYLTEQAVYQMNLLLGGGLVAPTRLLRIDIPKQDKILQQNKFLLQASLAVEGEDLEDILCLPSSIIFLKKRLGERFLQELPKLLDGTYYQEWLREQGFDNKIELEKQILLLVNTLDNLPPLQRPIEFRDIGLTKSAIESIIKDNKALRGAAILPTLALVEKYPEVIREVHLGDLLRFPKLFHLINRLYPRASLSVLMEQIPVIFKTFDPKNISKHFLLAWLTDPRDHKGDNFKVRVIHKKEGGFSL